MKQQKTLLLIALLASTVVSGTSQASLIARGTDMVYDDVNNITWTSDANLAQTSGYDADGFMIWTDAVAWADQLTLGGYTDWSLPSTPVEAFGFNVTSSQMGDLFYNQLGGVENTSIATTHNGNYNLFTNVQDYVYWSGSEYAPSTGSAWNFYTFIGYQNNVDKTNQYYAWAVRSGDVAASSVPVPAAVWLFLTGLGLLSVTRKKSLTS